MQNAGVSLYFRSNFKAYPMQKLLTFAAIALSSAAVAQTDSSAFYLQKALDEKAKGRRMEVVKALEKAQTFNKANQQVIAELGSAYLDIRMLAKAREKFS